MPDELRSLIKHHLVLLWDDLEQEIGCFYNLMIERDLFGTGRLVRNCGRIGANGQYGPDNRDRGDLAVPPLPHHRTYGSVYGGSSDYSTGLT